MDSELTKSFEEIDTRLDKTDQRLSHVENRLASIAATMFTRADADEMRGEFNSGINQVLTAVDGLAKQVGDFNTEFPAIKHQSQTMGDWVRIAAKKIGVPYQP